MSGLRPQEVTEVTCVSGTFPPARCTAGAPESRFPPGSSPLAAPPPGTARKAAGVGKQSLACPLAIQRRKVLGKEGRQTRHLHA